MSDEKRNVRRLPWSMASRFARCERGNFALLAALLLPVLLGSAALAVEYGVGLVTRSSNQRAGDAAAFAAALRYTASQSQADMRSAALQVARLNNIPPEAVSVELVPSPRGEGDAVKVDIASTQQLYLAPLVGAEPWLSIGTQSLAAIGGSNPGACVLALDPTQSGVVLSGGTSLAAPKCSVASNATLSVPCGTGITAESVLYDTTPPQQGCSGIRSPDGSAGKISKLSTPDPLVDNALILDTPNRLAAVAALHPVALPSVSGGPNITFAYTDTASVAPLVAQAGCSLGKTANWSGDWIVNCPSSSELHRFGSITVNAKSLQFNVGGSPNKRYEFSGAITVSNGTVSFPQGTYVIAKGIKVEGNGSVAFGSGAFWVGPNMAACAWNAGAHSICNNARLTFGSGSSFHLSAGFYSGGGSSLTLGGGNDNLFDLGASSNGAAIVLGGGSTTFMGDATTRPHAFRVRGHIQGGGGGSCIAISRAPQHDIAGSVLLDGAAILGAGVYTVDGSFLLGSGGGGGATCWGRQVSVEAIDVSVVLSGKTGVNTGSCANTAFCIAAGYNNVVFRAPTTGDTAGFAVIGPTNGRTAGASLTEGAGNARISGAFYFPTGPIVMNGGAGLGGGGGDCLQLIGSRIALAGGASAASDCLASIAGGGGSGRVVLVQ